MVWDSKYCRKGTDSTCLYISDGEEDVRFWILKATGGIHFLKKTVSLDKNVVKGFVPDLDEYLKESFRSLRIFTQTELRRSIPRWPRIDFTLLWKPVSGLSWPWYRTVQNKSSPVLQDIDCSCGRTTDGAQDYNCPRFLSVPDTIRSSEWQRRRIFIRGIRASYRSISDHSQARPRQFPWISPSHYIMHW